MKTTTIATMAAVVLGELAASGAVGGELDQAPWFQRAGGHGGRSDRRAVRLQRYERRAILRPIQWARDRADAWRRAASTW